MRLEAFELANAQLPTRFGILPVGRVGNGVLATSNCSKNGELRGFRCGLEMAAGQLRAMGGVYRDPPVANCPLPGGVRMLPHTPYTPSLRRLPVSPCLT